VSQLQRLDRALRLARADLVEAERLLFADPTDEFAQMSVELFRSEVESYREIVGEEQRFARALSA
jgi:hypothetical protein